MEPVAVEVKSDRIGLGWQEMIAEHRRKREERKQQRKNKQNLEFDPETYRYRIKNVCFVFCDTVGELEDLHSSKPCTSRDCLLHRRP